MKAVVPKNKPPIFNVLNKAFFKEKTPHFKIISPWRLYIIIERERDPAAINNSLVCDIHVSLY